MARCLYLHIGMHKTGTSSVQRALYDANPVLSRVGARYVDANVNHSELYLAFCEAPEKEHDNIKRGIRSRADALRRRREILDNYGDKLAACRNSAKLVISGEELCRLSLAGVEALRTFLSSHTDRVRVLAVTRDPLGFATSIAQEMIKGGSTIATETRSPVQPQYRARLSPYIDVFGRENVTVLDYDEARAGMGGLVRQVLRGMGLSPQVLEEIEAPHLNESLSCTAAHLLSRVNELNPRFRDEGSVDMRGLRTAAGLVRKLTGDRFAMPVNWQASVLAASRLDAEWLRETFGVDYCGAVPRDGEPSEPAIPPQMLAELAEIVNDASVKIEAFLGAYLESQKDAAGDREVVHALRSRIAAL
jgi:hypothetical protein